MRTINIAFLSMSHIVGFNPIVYDAEETKKEYLRRLKRYLKAGRWRERKYVRAQIQAYTSIMNATIQEGDAHGIDFYRYYILLDLLHILSGRAGADAEEKVKKAKEKYFQDFCLKSEERKIAGQILQALVNSGQKVSLPIRAKALSGHEKEYMRLIKSNFKFLHREPYIVLVTATMSAGKSTFINALTGKHVCLSQNMACTSKRHCIINKAFEDGYSYEYDYDLVMTAGQTELMNNNEGNMSDTIAVATHFDSILGNKRIIVNDSPGVNFSGDEGHKKLTDKLIKKKKYQLLIYIMNATQLGTNDEDEHLDFVKKCVGRKKIIFVVNKIDAFNVEEENVISAIEAQEAYLKKKGFKDPIICPVSSRAGYLAKRFKKEELSRSEKRELYNYVDKFERMNLPAYYTRRFGQLGIKNADTEEEQLIKTSGMAFVEKIIALYAEGGKVDGTALRKI